MSKENNSSFLTISYKIDNKPYIGIIDKKGVITHFERFITDHRGYKENVLYIFMISYDFNDIAEMEMIPYDLGEDEEDEFIATANMILATFKRELSLH